MAEPKPDPPWYAMASAEELRHLRAYDSIMQTARRSMTTASAQKEILAVRLRERLRFKTKQQVKIQCPEGGIVGQCPTPTACSHEGCKRMRHDRLLDSR